MTFGVELCDEQGFVQRTKEALEAVWKQKTLG
jgi:hypothetical protein